MSSDGAHCLTTDAEMFAAMDDVAEFAVAHANELAALDRATRLATPEDGESAS